MIEFGSDFHYINPGNPSARTLRDYYPSNNCYADGRQALIHLYQTQGWNRLWIPEYFCYDVISSLVAEGLNLVYYLDFPCFRVNEFVSNLPFRKGDALLRVNYFGLSLFRSNSVIPVPVIEDHTHDLIGDWALNSDADWCIASLRKTLPIAEGGILWSPVGHPLPEAPKKSVKNETVASLRWESMRMKEQYLNGVSIEKESFRRLFVETESYFDCAKISSLDEESVDYLSSFDIKNWYDLKYSNWSEMNTLRSNRFDLLMPEGQGCHPFSFTIICKTDSFRNSFRNCLIENKIYPAVLWTVPEDSLIDSNVRSFSERMLSVHCDGRYSMVDIQNMKSIIESILVQ